MSRAYIYAAVGFIAGVLSGVAAAGYYFHKRYEERLDEEVRSVKESFGRVYSYKGSHPDNDEKTDISVTDDDSIIKREVDTSKTDYTKYFENPDITDEIAVIDEVETPEEDLAPGEAPYVIDDYEYMQDEESTRIELLYFDDGLITDENWDPVEDLSRVVSKKDLEEFVKSDEDSIYTRSDARHCIYIIEKQDEPWEGFVERHPIIKETSYA